MILSPLQVHFFISGEIYTFHLSNHQAMCGRYTLSSKQIQIERRFNARAEAVIKETYNAAPSHPLPVIAADFAGKILFFRWGLSMPGKGHRSSHLLINIKAETLFEKEYFSRLVTHQRCIVPADGFYEWERRGKISQPYFFRMKEGALFAFAGIWEKYLLPGGETMYAFAIITTQANELMGRIHHRMPVILRKEDESRWLNRPVEKDFLQEVMHPLPAGEMESYPVSMAVNNPGINDPSLIRPVHLPGFPSLF